MGDNIKEGDEIKIKARLRSTHQEEDAVLTIGKNGEAHVTMAAKTRAITPGQACVFYNDSRVLGGGWITKEVK